MEKPVYEGKQLVITVGASQYFNCTRREAKAWERQQAKIIEEHVRSLVRVGPYSKHVKVQLVEPGTEAIVPSGSRFPESG